MRVLNFMIIAGEPSGDMLAAEVVHSIRRQIHAIAPPVTNDYQPLGSTLAPRFFGAGGPCMAAAGVEIIADMTRHSVIGLSDVFKVYRKLRIVFNQLAKLAVDRQPDVIICVDYSGFNRRFAAAIKNRGRGNHGWFHDWNPKIVQLVSPQVWASREGRVFQIARDFDLLLSIFPFEKNWYAQRVPRLNVQFIGHPMLDRYRGLAKASAQPADSPVASADNRPLGADAALAPANTQRVLLLPGSRMGELFRHLPVLHGAFSIMRTVLPNLQAKMVLPTDELARQAKQLSAPAGLEIQTGGLAQAMRQADIAIASTGTVTMECAYFGVPTIALYKTSWSTYMVGRRMVRVKYLAMPNLLADEEIFPEFIQHAATADNIAHAALDLLRDDSRRLRIRERLARIVGYLGEPGAADRAAAAILGLLPVGQTDPGQNPSPSLPVAAASFIPR
jgi:lipid-A-disaccharide synthase